MKKFITGLVTGTVVGYVLTCVVDVYTVVWRGVDLTAVIRESFFGGYDTGEKISKWNRKYATPKRRHN